jgi:protein O-GlcNAc transferase
MSSDFGQHTTGENVAGIFRHHNRKRFHVFAYALSPSDGSKTRTAIESTAETFREFSDLSTVQLAFAVNADGIHILVDMNGHTLGARSHVTALRPAPITIFDQVWARAPFFNSWQSIQRHTDTQTYTDTRKDK